MNDKPQVIEDKPQSPSNEPDAESFKVALGDTIGETDFDVSYNEEAKGAESIELEASDEQVISVGEVADAIPAQEGAEKSRLVTIREIIARLDSEVEESKTLLCSESPFSKHEMLRGLSLAKES